jgi:thymidylate synthase (FAD)
MPQRVEPKVFLVGYTTGDRAGLEAYLRYTDQLEFLQVWDDALSEGIHPGEATCSLYAKLCYKALTTRKNKNVKAIRDIPDNIRGAFNSGHGSIFEHCQINFIVTDCSRVYTHEQVRHRAGWAFSQTSGRYCRGDAIDLILDPITEPVNRSMELAAAQLEIAYRRWCARMGLDGLKGLYDALRTEGVSRKRPSPTSAALLAEAEKLGMKECAKPDPETGKIPMYGDKPDWAHDFERKKKITSALRRMLPNGQGNEMGMSANIRALRHVIQLRTHRAAEWEIRLIFNQVYHLVKERFPLIFHGARTAHYDGLLEVQGMRQQPYELEPNDPQALQFYTVTDLEAELARRQ